MSGTWIFEESVLRDGMKNLELRCGHRGHLSIEGTCLC